MDRLLGLHLEVGGLGRQRHLAAAGELHELAGAAARAAEQAPRPVDEALALAHGTDVYDKVAALRPQFVEWCAELEASSIGISLDHNDLHAYNVLGDVDGEIRFYDWGDSVVAHPFTSLLVPLKSAAHRARSRAVYLDTFRSVAGSEDLDATLTLALRVAIAARALTWDRALQAAREANEPVDDEWASAPVETLAMLLDPDLPA